jgi:hypothetical protein
VVVLQVDAEQLSIHRDKQLPIRCHRANPE